MDKNLLNIINFYKTFPQVKAIAIGGSTSANTNDKKSDIDVYIFVEKDIPLEDRKQFITSISSKSEVGGEYFGSGDEFFVDSLGQQLDCMYWNVDWFNSVVENTWIKHYPSNGYTTCFLYTLNVCKILYDPTNWLADLKETINSPYPQELKQNIITRNIMLMKDKPFASYYEQISKAIERKDFNSINHRVSAFLASYFDVIFAINELLHSGEKRLVKYANEHCKTLPENFEENINKLLTQPNNQTLAILDDMIKNLKKVL